MRLAKKYRDMIEQEWSEDHSGDGYWILLQPHLHRDGAHVVHESSQTKAYRALREVKTCDCGDCND